MNWYEANDRTSLVGQPQFPVRGGRGKENCSDYLLLLPPLSSLVTYHRYTLLPYPLQQAHHPEWNPLCPSGTAPWKALEVNEGGGGAGGGAGGGERAPAHQLEQPNQVSSLKVHCMLPKLYEPCLWYSAWLYMNAHTLASFTDTHHLWCCCL